MRRPLLAAALASALAAAASPAWALEDILFEDGQVRRGEILEVLEDGIRAKGKAKSGGIVEMKIPESKLDAEWFYNLRDRAAGTDAKAHLRLALWALDRGLFSRARLQVRRATELDPALVKDIQEGKLPEIRDGIAAKILESARRDLKAGLADRALQKVELLLARMPDTPAGAEAADFLPEVEAAAVAKEEKDRADARAKLAEAERKAEEERDRALAPVEETLQKAKKLGSAGLQEDNQPKALEMVGQALKMAEGALERMDSLAKSHEGDEAMRARVAELRGRTVAAMVKGHLHRAEMYVWRGSHPQAKAEIEKVEALDPGNSAADALAARIAEVDEQNSEEQRWRRGGTGDSRFGGRRGGGGGRGR
jgi:hypothetical protein